MRFKFISTAGTANHKKQSRFLKKLNWSIVIYTVALVSYVEQSDSVTHLYLFSGSFP